jgi:Ser/Thr protein kinase RdoA (MazF antagonist)
MLHGPLICDVAVACSYRWTQGEPPLAGIARFVAGYHAVTPLDDAELAILPDLVRARLALTLTLVNWQAQRFPDKREYVMRLNGELWSFLAALSDASRAQAQATLREAAR